MLWIKYQVVQSTVGEEDVLVNKKIGYSEANIAIAEAEAYNGKYEVVEDGKSYNDEPLAIEFGGTGAKTAAEALRKIGAAPAGLVSTTIYPKTYAAFMEELKSIYANMPNTKNTPKKFVYAGIETGGDTANGELGGGVWFVEINRSSATYGTIKASNEYYGDRRLDIYGTWGKWVDVSPNAFAPAGIVSKTIKIVSETELDNALTEEINTMANDSARFLVFAPTNSSVFGGIATLCRLYKRSVSGYGTADFIGYATYGPNTWQKSWYGGTWKPIEWVNPPMALGVEYRTTERHNGKVKYKKLISFGEFPQSTSKEVSTGIDANKYRIVGVHRHAKEIGNNADILHLASITHEYTFVYSGLYFINVTTNGSQRVTAEYLFEYEEV